MRRRIGMAACTGAAMFALAGLSRGPYTSPSADSALLRFSLRMSVAATENCRPRTPEELDALPAHMRTPEICTRDLASYSLVTRLDSAVPDTLSLVRGGIKGDRPLFVLEERTLPAGRHRVRVEVVRRPESGAPAVLAALDTVLALEKGGIQLVTMDGDSRRLTTRSSGDR